MQVDKPTYYPQHDLDEQRRIKRELTQKGRCALERTAWEAGFEAARAIYEPFQRAVLAQVRIAIGR